MTIFGGATEWRSTHRLSLTIQTTAAVTNHSNPYDRGSALDRDHRASPSATAPLEGIQAVGWRSS